VLHELTPQETSLEEAFLHLTKDSVQYHGHSGEHSQAATLVGKASR
jgi:ABC-2 type transport system ATP-binding protein